MTEIFWGQNVKVMKLSFGRGGQWFPGAYPALFDRFGSAGMFCTPPLVFSFSIRFSLDLIPLDWFSRWKISPVENHTDVEGRKRIINSKQANKTEKIVKVQYSWCKLPAWPHFGVLPLIVCSCFHRIRENPFHFSLSVNYHWSRWRNVGFLILKSKHTSKSHRIAFWLLTIISDIVERLDATLFIIVWSCFTNPQDLYPSFSILNTVSSK